MKKCTYCGKEYSDEKLVCEIDGSPLVDFVPPPKIVPNPAVLPNLNKTSKWWRVTTLNTVILLPFISTGVGLVLGFVAGQHESATHPNANYDPIHALFNQSGSDDIDRWLDAFFAPIIYGLFVGCVLSCIATIISGIRREKKFAQCLIAGIPSLIVVISILIVWYPSLINYGFAPKSLQKHDPALKDPALTLIQNAFDSTNANPNDPLAKLFKDQGLDTVNPGAPTNGNPQLQTPAK